MGIPRFRLNVQRLMIAVAIVAVLWAAVLNLLRPYPVVVVDGRRVVWSDGSGTTVRSQSELPRSIGSGALPFVILRWPDGSHSLHLRYTSRRNAPARKQEPGPGIPLVQKVTF